MKVCKVKETDIDVNCPCGSYEVDWDHGNTSLQNGRVIETGKCEDCGAFLIAIYKSTPKRASFCVGDTEKRIDLYDPSGRCPHCTSIELARCPKKLTAYQGVWGITEKATCLDCKKEIFFYHSCDAEYVVTDKK